MSSTLSATCHGSRASAIPVNTTASTIALRMITALRLYLSAQTPHSGTSGIPRTNSSALNSPTNGEAIRVRDPERSQLRGQQGEDLADTEALDHRRDPEDRDERRPSVSTGR